MLHPAKVAEIHRLIAEGELSQRQIARATGVSRASVGLIKRGKRPDRSHRESTEPFRPLPADVRCPGCGGLLTVLPCILCRDRAAQSETRPDVTPPTPAPPGERVLPRG